MSWQPGGAPPPYGPGYPGAAQPSPGGAPAMGQPAAGQPGYAGAAQPVVPGAAAPGPGAAPLPQAVPPQQPGYGAVAPPGFGAPQQPQAPGYGAVAPAGFGAPQQPQQAGAGYGAAPGAWAAAPPGPAGYAGWAPAAAGPVASVGLFGKIPCPQCGAPTTSAPSAGGAFASTAASRAGGLVGYLIMRAFLHSHYCPHHGKIEPAAFPPAHRRAISMRKIAMLGGAALLLGLVLILIVVANVLGAY